MIPSKAIETEKERFINHHVAADVVLAKIAKLPYDQQEKCFNAIKAANIATEEELNAMRNCVTYLNWIATPGKYNAIKNQIGIEFYNMINGIGR